MLKLKNINKKYRVGEEYVNALNDINLNFSKNEFVSILGSSGSGKTTLLNIIGGLDRYSSGDLLVEGKSTKDFKDKDWDSYRNTTIGFVFQSYNLISHLSILDNVAIALSLSGVSASERNKIAKKSLEDVGLEKHINKKPNQLSGGQMQRVAIARALVNDPKILLADEPTGALDSHTSIQIMELIKEISKDRLVIMVTHNPELANKYSDRIIRLADGDIIEDTKPFEGSDNSKDERLETKKTAMSFFTALKSSFKNLTTKKARTFITAFAGSIGIVSIALVLAISSGMSSYVKSMQEDTLSGFPITISQSGATSFDRMAKMTGKIKEQNNKNTDATVIQVEGDSKVHKNIYSKDVLDKGYTFIDYLNKNASKYTTSIAYTSGYKVKALTTNKNNEYVEVKATSQGQGGNPFRNSNVLSELPVSSNYVLSQFNVVSKNDENFKYPTKADEAVLIVDSDNKISKNILEALGYKEDDKVTYKDILGKTMSVISNDDYYNNPGNTSYFIPNVIDKNMYDKGYKVKIVAVLKAKDSTKPSSVSTGIGYTKALTDYMTNIEKESKLVKEQEKNKDINILAPNKVKIDDATYTSVMQQIGGNTDPTQISIYPTSFSDKEKIIKVINDYNKQVIDKYGSTSEDHKTYSIDYTDLAETIGSTMMTMINTITVILTAFAAISLIVSSIMIGIITYVSVVERTKEIGIMRAIGARKKDISRIFNAEAIIIGLISGVLGVAIAAGLTIPANTIIAKAINIEGFSASLPIFSATMLVLLSVVLTFIAGLIPSRIASKKQPVEALRSE